MAETSEMLGLLRFELKFLEDGGYGRSPHRPWRPSFIFEDSPTCLNFSDPARPHACSECLLTEFVPAEKRKERFPCRHIPLTPREETVEGFYRSGSQIELEEALKSWLRKEIARLEAEQPAAISDLPKLSGV